MYLISYNRIKVFIYSLFIWVWGALAVGISKSALLLIVLLFASIIPILHVNGAETSATGQYTVNNVAPTINIALYESDETTSTTTLSPQLEYALKITISDSNSLQDVAQIKVILFYDTDNTVVGTPPATDDPATRATYQWDPTNGWQLIGPAGSTWGINTADSKAPSDLTATQGDWWLHFIPGKVAHEANTDASDDWDIIVEVTDSSGNTYTASMYGLTMLWYGEISIGVSTIDFGNLDPGTAATPAQQNPYTLTLIANGNYAVQTKADPQWSSDTGYTAILNTDSVLDDGEFQLVTDDDSTLDETDSLLVTDTYQTIPGHSSDPGPTSESGATLSLYSWVQLGNGLMPGTYTGAIYYQIING